jgi:amidase
MKSAEMVEETLHKIKSIDHSGYELRSVLAVSSQALDQAREYDKSSANLPLAGFPIHIKDNIEAIGLPATAGSLALADTPVVRDSTIASRLRAAGAIIVGATNLSEWANIRSDRSTSGWSAVGGLTANPWKHSQSAGGSSSGSGAAVAAQLTQWAIGSETDGSIICPASLNGCVGIKPTVGSIPRDAMIPISPSQDTPGPMAHTVGQAARLLDVLTDKKIYSLAAASENKLRIGLVKQWFTKDDRVNALFDNAVAALAKSGITVVEINLPEPSESDNEDELNVMLHEILSGMVEYLAGRSGVRVKNLKEIVEFNQKHADTELAHFGQELFEKSLELGGRDAEYKIKRVRNLQWANQVLALGLESADVLIGCTYGPAWTSTLGQGDDFGTASWITPVPAVAGTPIGTIPMGLVDGLPVGLGFVVGRNQEESLISVMAQAERTLGLGVLLPTFIK